MLMLPILAMALATTPTEDVEVDPDCSGNTAQMVACANRAFERAQSELDSLWGTVNQGYAREDRSYPDALSPTRLEAAQAAQAAWLQYRDAECTLRANDESRGGTMYPLTYIGCRTEMTLEKIDEFKVEPGE